MLVNDGSRVSGKFQGFIEISEIFYKFPHTCRDFHIEWSRKVGNESCKFLFGFAIAS